METSAVQKTDMSAIVDKVERAAWRIMGEATIEGGMHWAPSARAIGAVVKYIGRSEDTYRDNPIVGSVIGSIRRTKGEPGDKVDFKTLDAAEVMRAADEVAPMLEAEGERGAQTKAFLYGLAETMVSASGSGLMGMGKRVNEDEARFLADLRAHLRI